MRLFESRQLSMEGYPAFRSLDANEQFDANRPTYEHKTRDQKFPESILQGIVRLPIRSDPHAGVDQARPKINGGLRCSSFVRRSLHRDLTLCSHTALVSRMDITFRAIDKVYSNSYVAIKGKFFEDITSFTTRPYSCTFQARGMPTRIGMGNLPGIWKDGLLPGMNRLNRSLIRSGFDHGRIENLYEV